MAVTSYEDRLNANADLVIMREIVAYFVATRLTSEDEIAALIKRIMMHVNKDVEHAAKSSAENAKNLRLRYESRLRLFSEAINYYRGSTALS